MTTVSPLRKEIVKVLDKEFGKGTTLSLTDLPDGGAEEYVSTDSMIVDSAIGRMGLPIGMLSSITGLPASGKSTLIAHLIKSVQRMEGLAVLLDSEHTFDPERAARIGVRNEDVLLIQDLHLEKAFSIVIRVCSVAIAEGSQRPIMIFLDSHSATATRAEVEADEDASRTEVASSAKVTSMNLRRIISAGMLKQGRVGLVFACQLKDNVSMSGWGGGYTYIASRPIDYHSSVIFRMRKIRALDHDTGVRVSIEVKKNKVGPPFRKCEIEIGADGIDESNVLLDAAVECGLVTTSGGGWYALDGRDKKFKRREWKALCDERPDLRRTLFGRLTGQIGEK